MIVEMTMHNDKRKKLVFMASSYKRGGKNVLA
jgi:hypothetical protein